MNLFANAQTLSVGQRVRVVQHIRERDREWQTTIEGVIESIEPRKTGSWFAHGRDDKLWLQRMLLRKADGEQVLLNVDAGTEITRLA